MPPQTRRPAPVRRPGSSARARTSGPGERSTATRPRSAGSSARTPGSTRRPPARKRQDRIDRRWAAAAAVLAVGLLVVAGAQRMLDSLIPDEIPFLPGAKPCTVTVGDERVELEREQAANAATITGVGKRMAMPDRAVTVALATAMQESTLRNVDHGDRDSLGLFQQRPSQGWGTAAQVQDPVYAATRFYRGLRGVSGWQRLSLTRAAQAVQRSALPDAYAKHESTATTLMQALTGRAEAALVCETAVPDGPVQRLGASGLTARAAAVRSGFERTWGRQSLGGFDPDGVSTGHMAGSAHYDGRAIDIFFRPATRANQREGWAISHWLVAQASTLGIATVIYDDRIWTARRSDQGWRPYRSDDPGNDILQHRDHIHVDVIRGD